MDRRTLLAIVLSALVLIFLPILLERSGLLPRPAPPQESPTARAPGQPGAQAPPPSGPTEIGVPGGASRPGATSPDASAPQEAAGTGRRFASTIPAPARVIRVSNELYDADFDSRGARLIGVTLKQFRTVADTPVRLSGLPTLTLDLGDDPSAQVLTNAIYDVSESLDAQGRIRRLRFVAADTAGARITQSYSFDPESYLMGLDVTMDGVLQQGFTDYHFGMRSWPLVTERNVQEDLNNLQAVSLVGKDVRRHRFGDLRKGPRADEGVIRWSAVRSKYFTVAVIPEQASSKAVRAYVPRDAVTVAPGTPAGGAQVASSLVLPVPPAGFAHRLGLYVGPNDYGKLEKAGYRLQELVDLGWRWLLPFSRAILKVMVFLQNFITNYGLVIIVLSALVKLVFHPLTASSMRSMRAMQRIQPEVEKLRKRYEKDPQKLNQAVFAMYKENKVSPFGGCLPMLIQMPVLFALYQVFLHAIELRQAPFVSWIDDLSAPDVLFHVAGFPIRILPIVMLGSALLQQKLTPTDPRQVNMMYLMNLLMLVLFYNLPSGLVLYWTVTNLLTAAQQYLVTHGESSALPATT